MKAADSSSRLAVSSPCSWTAVQCGPLSKFAGWNEAQRGVRSGLVMVLAPSFVLVPEVFKRQEPIGVEALVAQIE
jgi:hypothetical protein